MKTQYFYRVENSYGEGPYTCSRTEGVSEYDDKYNTRFIHNSFRHPCPDRDGLADILSKKEFRYGFSSIEQLLKWFYAYSDRMLDFLRHQGFHISVYEVSDLKEGNLHQAAAIIPPKPIYQLDL
jgi:hypothetical protein